TTLGVAHLEERVRVGSVVLYVEGENAPARRTYERLGFAIAHVHATYNTAGLFADPTAAFPESVQVIADVLGSMLKPSLRVGLEFTRRSPRPDSVFISAT